MKQFKHFMITLWQHIVVPYWLAGVVTVFADTIIASCMHVCHAVKYHVDFRSLSNSATKSLENGDFSQCLWSFCIF